MDRIAVTHDELGRPGVAVVGELAGWLAERSISTLHLSISDERDHAVAFAVAVAEA